MSFLVIDELSIQWAILWTGRSLSEGDQGHLAEIRLRIGSSAGKYQSNVFVQVDSARIGAQEPERTHHAHLSKCKTFFYNHVIVYGKTNLIPPQTLIS